MPIAVLRSPVTTRLLRGLLPVTLALAGTAGAARLAFADCQQDLTALMNKRNAAITSINSLPKKEGKLDPTAACPRMRTLAAVEGQVLAYMQKNKDWCNLPDDLVEKMSGSQARTAKVAVQACGFAAKMKKMEQMQAQQQNQQQQVQAVKLPTGPL